MKKTAIAITALIIVIGYFAFMQFHTAFAFPVESLPDDNLVENPWFRRASNPSRSGLDDWIDAAGEDTYWSSSQKESNPSPDLLVSGVCGNKLTYCGTSARLSTKPGQSGGVGEVGVDAYLFQVVAADSSHRKLKFFAHWVAHTIDPAEVNVYGSDSSNGPWTLVWQPFHQVIVDVIKPPPGQGTDWLWQEMTSWTPPIETTLVSGYPYYKIEIHAKLPEERSGFKITGIYFTAAPEGATEPSPTPTVTPPLAETEDRTPTPTSSMPPSARYTLTPSPTPTSGSSSGSNSVHVGDLEGASQHESSTTWQAEVSILVHDAEHNNVINVLVMGNWNTPEGTSMQVECTTDSSGVCFVSQNGIDRNTESVIFNVENLSLVDYSYAEADNHDLDGDSNGKMIVVSR